MFSTPVDERCTSIIFHPFLLIIKLIVCVFLLLKKSGPGDSKNSASFKPHGRTQIGMPSDVLVTDVNAARMD